MDNICFVEEYRFGKTFDYDLILIFTKTDFTLNYFIIKLLDYDIFLWGYKKLTGFVNKSL